MNKHSDTVVFHQPLDKIYCYVPEWHVQFFMCYSFFAALSYNHICINVAIFPTPDLVHTDQ